MVNNGKAGEKPEMSYNADFLTLLNSTQTIKFKVCDHTGVYQEVTSGTAPATITIGSYKFATGTDNAVSAVNASASASTISASVDAARTATTTLGYSSVADGYTFVGWFDEAGNALASTTIYPTEGKTYYAYFRPTSYSRDVTNGNYGTLCLPFDAELAGATAYSIAYKTLDANSVPTSLVIKEVGTSLSAGVPYIVEYSASSISATYSGNPTTAQTVNGLVGNLGDNLTVTDGNYVVVGTQVRKVNGASVTCKTNYAYVDMSDVMTKTQYDAQGNVPGRLVQIPLAPETATTLENVETGENVVKFFENGQLLIKKNGVVYDVMGRVVR